MSRTEAAEVKKYEEIFKSKERLGLALGIAKDPMLKSIFAPEMRNKALELEAVTKDHQAMKEKLLRQDPALVSKADKEEFAKLTEQMRRLEKAFDAKYGSTLDSIIQNREGSIDGLTNDLRKILADPKQLIATSPAIYINRELPLTINPSTGQFVIGTPRDAEYFKNMAGSEAYQSSNKNAVSSLELAKKIASLTGSESSPDFIRDRWCVAFSDWAVLKSNLGDAVPDFDKFIKDCVDNNLINKDNMYVDTGKVLSYYSQGLGTFERNKFYEGKIDNTPFSEAERDRRYLNLGEDLLTNKPQAITLRVHDGHTISLHRNPPDVTGKVTYTVVDTGNSKMNGTIFDPENPLESSIGKIEKSNSYKDYLPKHYDMIK
jgi:hypothetical protein